MRKKNNGELSGVKEIARRAQVSIATVDRVLHNRPGVSVKTKAKIEAIIKEIDYKPNLLARRLASRKVFKFAVLIPKESNETEYWRGPLTGIQTAWSEIKVYGVEVSFFLYDLNNRDTFVQEGDKLLEGGFHGVVVAPSFIEEAIDFVSKCKAKKIKCVFINSDISNIQPLSYIGPDLFQSGRLAGNLCQYLVPKDGKVLILNISRVVDAEHHLMRKADGFRSYFENERSDCSIDMLTVQKTDYESVISEVDKYLATARVDLLFVTNSRVFTVARYFAENKINNIKLVGYDYLEQNLKYLDAGIIDFLICQKPVEQGYQALLTLHQYFINESESVEKMQLMPIDIITKENYKFYKN